MGVPKCIKQLITTIKELINKNTIIVGKFNNPLTGMDRSSKQKIDKETMVSRDTLDQVDLTDTFRIFHSKATLRNKSKDEVKQFQSLSCIAKL